MSYLEWSDAFSVNIEEIDNQHKKLIGMINTLHEAIVTRKTHKIQEDIIKEMVQYTQTHFLLEEQYMKKFDYLYYPNHTAEHEKFTAKAIELQKRMENGGFILPLEVLNFLRDWWKGHIQGTDKKYSKCFNEHGLF